jgi:hypothetical protein
MSGESQVRWSARPKGTHEVFGRVDQRTSGVADPIIDLGGRNSTATARLPGPSAQKEKSDQRM